MLSILIVNWNTRDLLRACLLSIRANCAEIPHEILVFDSASVDESAAMVAREFPEVRLVSSTTNDGFAAGNNRLYEISSGEYVWLLNPDTEVLEAAAEALISFVDEHPSAGAVASALIDARDGHVQRSCRTFPVPGAWWAQALGLARAFPRSKRFGFYKMGWWSMRDARVVDQPMASSLLLRREAIDESGGLFDEAFPIFFNDVDLCWRLKQSAWVVWFCPKSRVKHWGGASTSQLKPEMIRESHRSFKRFYLKHWLRRYPFWKFWPTLWMSDLAGVVRAKRAQMQTKRPSI